MKEVVRTRNASSRCCAAFSGGDFASFDLSALVGSPSAAIVASARSSAAISSPANPSARPGDPCPAAISAAISSSRSEEHTSELQSLMRISYAVFCLKKKTHTQTTPPPHPHTTHTPHTHHNTYQPSPHPHTDQH